MRITIFLLIVGFCLVSAKYLSFEATDSNALLRVRRSDSSEDSSSSVEQNSSGDDDDDDDNEENEQEDKIKRKSLEHQEKEKRKQEEQQRKIEEKQAKAQRKEEEKKEKEERKRIEKLEKEKRKEEEKRIKEENKKQEKQRKDLEKLEKETLQGKPVNDDFLETEEENSVELSDIWKEHIYVKYGLTLASTKLEKQAALNKYIQEELGLNQNSTKSERLQAVVQLIQNKLQTDVAARTALKNQLISHINAISIQKLRADLDNDIAELNNKTEILNNISLPWVLVAKQQIEEQRSFLQTISQFLSSILPNWLTGAQNVQSQNSSSVNGPQSGITSDPNAPIENNVDPGNSEVPAATSQSDNGVPTTTNTNNSPAQNSGPASSDTNGDAVVANNNGNTEPSSNDIVVSGGSDDAQAVNSDTGVVSSINTEFPSKENNASAVGGGNVASTNDNNTKPVDSVAVQPENVNSVSSSNIDVINNAVTTVDPGASSIYDNEVSSTNVNSDAQTTKPNVLSPPNSIGLPTSESASESSFEPTETTLDNSNSGDFSSPTDALPVKFNSSSGTDANAPTSSAIDISPSATSDGVSQDNDNAASINKGVTLTSNVSTDISQPATGSKGNEAISDNTANNVSLGGNDSNVDKNINDMVSGVNEAVLVSDITGSSNTNSVPTVDTASALVTPENNDPATTIDSNANQITSITNSIVAPSDVNVISSEANAAAPDDSSNFASSNTATGALNLNADNVPSDVSKNTLADSLLPSSLPSTSVTEDVLSVNSDTSTGSSDTTLSNPSSSVASDLSPAPVVTSANGNELAIDNKVNTALTAETNNTSDPSSAGSETPSVSVDAVSTSVTESSSSDLVVSSNDNSGIPENNGEIELHTGDIVLQNKITTDNTEVVNSNHVVPSNEIENAATEIVPTESISPDSRINDSSNESSNAVSSSSSPPKDLFASEANSNGNIINIETTIAPEIINSVQTQDNGITLVQSTPIVTESPVDPGKANEAGTTVSDIVNVNTVLTTVANTSATSEPLQKQTTESTFVDNVSPVELQTPTVIEGITLPNEPGASVVEVVPQ